MSTLSHDHKKVDPKTRQGRCSCLMWWVNYTTNERHDGSTGLVKSGDAGFCDEPAYGPPAGKNELGVPGLACPKHGGPDEPQSTATEQLEATLEAWRAATHVPSMSVVDSIVKLVCEIVDSR